VQHVLGEAPAIEEPAPHHARQRLGEERRVAVDLGVLGRSRHGVVGAPAIAAPSGHEGRDQGHPDGERGHGRGTGGGLGEDLERLVGAGLVLEGDGVVGARGGAGRPGRQRRAELGEDVGGALRPPCEDQQPGGALRSVEVGRAARGGQPAGPLEVAHGAERRPASRGGRRRSVEDVGRGGLVVGFGREQVVGPLLGIGDESGQAPPQLPAPPVVEDLVGRDRVERVAEADDHALDADEACRHRRLQPSGHALGREPTAVRRGRPVDRGRRQHGGDAEDGARALRQGGDAHPDELPQELGDRPGRRRVGPRGREGADNASSMAHKAFPPASSTTASTSAPARSGARSWAIHRIQPSSRRPGVTDATRGTPARALEQPPADTKPTRSRSRRRMAKRRAWADGPSSQGCRRPRRTSVGRRRARARATPRRRRPSPDGPRTAEGQW
jgi:hypothetical protein